MWQITQTTLISVGCTVNAPSDIVIASGQGLTIEGTLNMPGWINVTQGAQLVVEGGQIHIVGGAPGAQIQVFNGARMTVRDATLELDGLGAPGISNQANITIINSQVTSRGFFAATANSVMIATSTINVTAPPVASGVNGADAVLKIGGRTSANVYGSTFIAQAAGGGFGNPGARGGDGGAAIADFQARSMSTVTITVSGGEGGKGGQGANGASGGDGGSAGDATLTLSSTSISGSTVCAYGGNGGVGARGSPATVTSAGNGGQGREGGDATLLLSPPDTATVTSTTLCATGGFGGTGGSGGNYGGNENNKHGGNGGQGAIGGLSRVVVSAPNNVIVTDSVIRSNGGPGGLGGLSGAGVANIPTTNGRAGYGGKGGAAFAFVNSTGLGVDINRTTVRADAGAGGNGGQAQQEGGWGGHGGDSVAGAFGNLTLKLVDSCYSATGGKGGGGASGSLAGYGGDGGNSTTTLRSNGTVTIIRSCAGAVEGAQGKPANEAETARYGQAGFPDLILNASRLAARDTSFGNSLDDYKGCVRSAFYNVTFSRPGSEIIPEGCAVIDRYWYFGAYAYNGQAPIQGVTVSVADQSVPANFFGTTDAGGNAAFELIGATYTSDILSTFTHSYRIDASFRGEIQNRTLTLNRNWNISFLYPENVRAPIITMLAPKSQSYPIDSDHPFIHLKIKVDDPDDVLTGVPTQFQVWVCITPEPVCLDVVDISGVNQTDPNTGEVTYDWDFNVSRVSDFPSASYNVCAQASDHVFTSSWNCVPIDLNQRVKPREQPQISAGGNVREVAERPVNFDGRVSNLDKLELDGITVLVYQWDFDGDGTWDYSSPARAGGGTVHIFPNVAETTVYQSKFQIIDSLGRTKNDTRTVTVEHYEAPPVSFLWLYAFVIFYSVAGIVGITVTGYMVQRRRKRIVAEEAQRREAEILANIFECPRCGDLLPEKFAICVRCGTEDSIASMRKTVSELKQVGVIVLEEEDMIDKAAVSFEGRDFETANAYLTKVKARVDVNRKRHKATTQLIRRARLYSKMIEEQGRDLSALEPELYHAELALGRSDFDGAEQMVEVVRKKILAVVYEDKRREILERLTKLERNVKAYQPKDEADTTRAAETMKLIERAKVAMGRKSYVEAVGYYTDAFTQMEGSPPEALVTEPTDTELDLFETRLKMQEEGVYMGPSAPSKPTEEKVWRPGEKEFKVDQSGAGGMYTPGQAAGVMTEEHSHGRTHEAPPAPAPAPKPAAPVSGAQPSWSSGPAKPSAQPSAPPAPSFQPPAGPAPVAAPTLPPAPAPAPSPAPPAAPAPQKPAPGPAPMQASGADVMEPLKPLAPPRAPKPAAPAAAPGAPAKPALKCAVCATVLQPNWQKCPKCATPVPGAARPAGPAPPSPPPASRPMGPPPAPAAAPAPPAGAAVADKCPNCAKPVKAAWKKCPYCAHTLHG